MGWAGFVAALLVAVTLGGWAAHAARRIFKTWTP
jgi:hypothetical protein